MDNDKDTPIRSVAETVSPIDLLCASSVNLMSKPLGAFQHGGHNYFIPRYLFVGPRGGGDPIRVGLFAGVHGDETEGTFALIEFIQNLEKWPKIAQGFCLFVYPIANPSGFEAGTHQTAGGVNIAHDIWKNSTSPEVQALQSELWMHGFDGVVYLNTSPSASELAVAIGGPIFARHLLGSALNTAQDVLPQTVDSSRTALPPLKSAMLEGPSELLRAAPGLKARPFEVVITIPQRSPAYLQKTAVSLLLQSIFEEYRNFIAFGANL